MIALKPALSTALAASLAAALVACGAASTLPPPSSAPPPSMAKLESSSLTEWERPSIDPAFTRALADYTVVLDNLQLTGPGEADMRIRHALRLLADAIENVPNDYDSNLIKMTAAQIRNTEALMILAIPSEQGDIRAAKDTLELVSQVLLHLSRFSYRSVPDVLIAARRFDDAVRQIDVSEELRPDRAGVIDALEEARDVLQRMHTAVARGELR